MMADKIGKCGKCRNITQLQMLSGAFLEVYLANSCLQRMEFCSHPHYKQWRRQADSQMQTTMSMATGWCVVGG